MNDSIFYTKSGANGFDNLAVDVPALYSHYPLSDLLVRTDSVSSLRNRSNFYRNGLIPLKFRLRTWQQAFRAQRDISWFEELNAYWTTILGGRPLWSPHDVYFLKNVYRIKFQQNTLPDTEDPNVHLQAWQRPESLYSLLHLLTKETWAIDARIVQRALRLAGKAGGGSLLEYGCGLAPLTYAALKFLGSSRGVRFHLADLASLPFHYAAWRLRGDPNVNAHLLEAERGFALDLNEPLDVIFCMQVFEHLNKPLETVQRFHKMLNKNGVLVFDFMLTKGEGLDSIQAVLERDQVLDFINANFDVQPKLDTAKTVDLTFARKLT